MKQALFTATCLSGFFFFACKENPKPVGNTATAAQKAADSIAARALEPAIAAPTTPPDSLIVYIDSMGKVTLGDREVDLDNLAKILVDSSQALQKKFGKAPKTITYKSNGALMGIRGVVHDAIDDAEESLKKQKNK